VSTTLAEQTQNAFDFISKLYFETSYLVKEVEGQLQQEDEAFVIGRLSGYAVTTRTSSGLDAAKVEMWFPRSLTVFFVPEELAEMRRGQTHTALADSLRVLLLHIELYGKHLDEPRVLAGYISNARSKRKDWTKFESLLHKFAYRRRQVLDTIPRISYEDATCSFEGELFEEPLYSINSAEDVQTLLVRPMVDLYRQQTSSA
jgi:hypothetical protein